MFLNVCWVKKCRIKKPQNFKVNKGYSVCLFLYWCYLNLCYESVRMNDHYQVSYLQQTQEGTRN